MNPILKFILAVIFLNLIAHKSIGQQQFLSLRQGLIISFMSDPKFLDTNESKFGYTAGISYEYGISKHLSLGIEVNYENRGYLRYNVIIDTSNGGLGLSHVGLPTSFNFRYFSFTLKITEKVNLGKKYFGFLSAGIMPAYLILIKEIKQTTSGFYQPVAVSNVPFIDITDKAQEFDFGLFGDIGLGYKFNDIYFVDVSFRLQQSLTTMDKNGYFPEGAHYNGGYVLAAKLGMMLK